MAYGFFPFVGGFMFWVVLVASIIIFASYKKLYPVLYVFSVSLYVFAVTYWIDVFMLGKNSILLILFFSSVLFMILGYHLSKVLHHDD